MMSIKHMTSASIVRFPLCRQALLALFVAVALCLGHRVAAAEFPEDPAGWPAVTATNKPWTRWWWFGSAVDKANLTRQLEEFARTGIGGVEICPIYGAVGAEDRALPFLSPAWMAMFGHTTSEAKRLGLGVDMTTGTGWPFGGPQITPDIASAGLEVFHHQANGDNRIEFALPKGQLQCLRAYDSNGTAVDLTGDVKNGKLSWQAAAGSWEIVGLASRPAVQKVKRAAPGGEGYVVDPFSASAMDAYLARFSMALEGFGTPLPRAWFHDSFEYYNAAWTSGFFAQFKAARGYDLRDQLPAFAGIGDHDTVCRVRADYRETLSELHLAFLQRWAAWAKSHGGIIRNQAHGSPGCLLDHYAVAAIPETELYQKVDSRQLPMIRMAASAAHGNGTTLASAEIFTWLAEHFKVTPENLKEAADLAFLGGINHLFFHGIPYSPDDVPWPGWLFYASTDMGPNGGLWRDLPAFTGYLQRCQSILQAGQPSSDVLIYFPAHDLWHSGQDKLPQFSVHNQDKWLWPTTFYRDAMELWDHGITFDYASDAMLARATVKDHQLTLGGHAYGTLVLPGVKHINPETLKKILDLTSGATVLIVQDGWPTEVPGYFQQQPRRTLLLDMESSATNNRKAEKASGSLLPVLARHGVRRETMTDAGLRFIRRTHDNGYHYFVVNRGGKVFDGIVPLAVPFRSALVLDPWNPSRTGTAKARESGDASGIALRLEPGQSIVIRTFNTRDVTSKPWLLDPPNPRVIPIAGPWNLRFIEGGPALPAPVANTQPASWTTLPDPAAANFSGTARYATSFDLTATPVSCRLDLGRVANTARVFLNGQLLGISWCEPHVLDLISSIKQGSNRLEIEVTNLAANRIADLDRRKVPWKNFHEINFVNINYKNFDASGWEPLESGLLGPVRLWVTP